MRPSTEKGDQAAEITRSGDVNGMHPVSRANGRGPRGHAVCDGIGSDRSANVATARFIGGNGKPGLSVAKKVVIGSQGYSSIVSGSLQVASAVCRTGSCRVTDKDTDVRITPNFNDSNYKQNQHGHDKSKLD